MASRRCMLVEGANDKHVLLAIQGRFPIRLLDKDEVDDCGSWDKLAKQLPIRLKASDIEQLGIIVDADSDVASRWSQLTRILENAGYAGLPIDPNPAGTLIEPPPMSLLPRVGIWLMPDNRSTGILEDFLRYLVPEGCSLMRHATEVVGSLPEVRFRPVSRPKAEIHTWLAWQEDPGRPLGQAITAKFFNVSGKEVTVFLTWLERLYTE